MKFPDRNGVELVKEDRVETEPDLRYPKKQIGTVKKRDFRTGRLWIVWDGTGKGSWIMPKWLAKHAS